MMMIETKCTVALSANDTSRLIETLALDHNLTVVCYAKGTWQGSIEEVSIFSVITDSPEGGLIFVEDLYDWLQDNTLETYVLVTQQGIQMGRTGEDYHATECKGRRDKTPQMDQFDLDAIEARMAAYMGVDIKEIMGEFASKWPWQNGNAIH